jgi:hypothetical protein
MLWKLLVFAVANRVDILYNAPEKKKYRRITP